MYKTGGGIPIKIKPILNYEQIVGLLGVSAIGLDTNFDFDFKSKFRLKIKIIKLFLPLNKCTNLELDVKFSIAKHCNNEILKSSREICSLS